MMIPKSNIMQLLAKGATKDAMPVMQKRSLCAFNYMKVFDHLMVPEHKAVFTQHVNFCTMVNNITGKYLANAKCLQTIRDVYKAPEMGKEIQSVIDQFAEMEKIDKSVLVMTARDIKKFDARDRMLQLNYHQDVENIHNDNLKKYDSAVGPTHEFLKKKYSTDAELEAGSKRTRSDEDMKRDFGQKAPEVDAEKVDAPIMNSTSPSPHC
jgi:hypothetical protein